MSRFKLAAMMVVVLSAAACRNDSNLASPITPTPVPVTDTFTGTLNKNGATTYPFSVSSVGVVYATLVSITDSTTVVGLSLGAWNGSGCTIILSNDQAVQGTTVAGTVTGFGTLCARVYDVGKVEDGSPMDYEISVTHP